MKSGHFSCCHMSKILYYNKKTAKQFALMAHNRIKFLELNGWEFLILCSEFTKLGLGALHLTFKALLLILDSVCVCVCVCVHVYVVYEDTNLYNDMGMT